MTSVFPVTEPELIIHTEIDDAGQVVTSAIGAIDAATIQVFERHLETVVTRRHLDLRLVGFCSAAGVAALVRLAPSSQILSSPAVTKVFELCGVSDRFELIDANRPHAFERAEFGLCTMDADHRFRYVNPSMAAIHGVQVEHHIGRRPEEIFDFMANDCSPIVDRVLQSRIPETHLVHSSFDGLELMSRCSYHASGFGFAPVVSVVVQPMLTPMRLELPPSAPRVAARASI